jgi:hypothetical protein
MTGMSETGWRAAADAGAGVTLAVPIEMQMRHGMPPAQKALDLGMSLSLSTDVECTMTADMSTQMRGVMTLQRMFANELALQGKDYPKLMSVADALALATDGGQKASFVSGVKRAERGPSAGRSRSSTNSIHARLRSRRSRGCSGRRKTQFGSVGPTQEP